MSGSPEEVAAMKLLSALLIELGGAATVLVVGGVILYFLFRDVRKDLASIKERLDGIDRRLRHMDDKREALGRDVSRLEGAIYGLIRLTSPGSPTSMLIGSPTARNPKEQVDRNH